MQRHPIALAITNDGAKSMRADRMNGLDDFSANLEYFRRRILDASLAIEVNENAAIARNHARAFHQTAAVAFFMIEDAKGATGIFLPGTPELQPTAMKWSWFPKTGMKYGAPCGITSA